jgi:ribosomal protein S18 acetylase RimI-like enzyme
MKIEFRKAIIPDEIPALRDFDKKAFHAHPADLSSVEEWGRWESHWVLLDEEIVGCISMETKRKTELWIASTGLLPEFCGRGLGNKLKQWEIDYAKNNGYPLIGTMMRQSNEKIIGLNKKFGFTVRKIVPGVYLNPDETAVVMELRVT